MTLHSQLWLYIGLVAAIALIALDFYSRKLNRDLLARFASQRLLPELTRTLSRPKIFVKNALVFASVILIFFALARPQWGYRWEETKTRGIDIVFAIDTSKSMLAEDVKPDRLERAKLSVLDLVNILQGDRIGIVAFSGQAFLQCPLTLDYDAFRMSLEALDTNVIQRGGTNISAAIEESEIAFAATSNRKIIVLISDGEELEDSALSAAEKAAKNGVVIYTLGVGGAKGEFIPVRDDSGGVTLLKDEQGNLVKSRLNEDTLSKIAKATGGFYEPLTSNGMDTIYNEGLKKIPQDELSSRMRQLAIERFQLPLGLAILLLAINSLIGTRKLFVRRSTTSLLTVIFALGLPALPPQAKAQNAADPIVQSAPKDAATPQTPNASGDSYDVLAQNIDAAQPNQKPKYAVSENPDAREFFNLAIDAKSAGDIKEAREFFIDAVKSSPEDFALHSDVYYNIGNIDYNIAKTASAKMESAQTAEKKVGAAFAQAEQSAANAATVLQNGRALLEKEEAALKAAKDETAKKQAMEKSPLKDKQFQETLKQSIGACEASLKASEGATAAIEKGGEQWRNLEELVQKAIKDYADSLELNPENSDAEKNLQISQNAQTSIKEEAQKLAKISAQSLPALAKIKKSQAALIEELKKLLRDDNQQNQNQQQQQQQNQQDQQQNQQDQQQQNQNQQQQNKQDSQQNQQQDKQDNQNQQQQNQDKQKQQEQNQQNKQEEQKQDSQKQKNDSAQKQNDSQQQPKSEKEKQEQAVNNSQDSKADMNDKKKEQSAAEKQNESAVPQEKKAAEAKAAKEDSAEEKENFRKAEGAMTRAEAKQLLDSLKDDEKFLPLRGFGTQKKRYESTYKDW